MFSFSFFLNDFKLLSFFMDRSYRLFHIVGRVHLAVHVILQLLLPIGLTVCFHAFQPLARQSKSTHVYKLDLLTGLIKKTIMDWLFVIVGFLSGIFSPDRDDF